MRIEILSGGARVMALQFNHADLIHNAVLLKKLVGIVSKILLLYF